MNTELALVARERARVFLLAAVAIPLLSWVYNPHDVMPHGDLIASRQELIAWLRSFPGDVFLPAHPYEGVLAGKQWHPDIAAIHDALQPEIGGIRGPLATQIVEEIDQEKFDAVVLDGSVAETLAEEPWLPPDLASHYPILGLVPGGDVGDPFGPHAVYFLLPCREKKLALAKGWTLVETAGQTPCAPD